MAQAGPRCELGFYHHGGEAGARSTMHLQQFQAGVLFQQQQQSQGPHAGPMTAITHQLQRQGNLPPHPQGQHLTSKGSIEAHQPGVCGAGSLKHRAQKGVLDPGFQSGKAFRQIHPSQRITITVPVQPQGLAVRRMVRLDRRHQRWQHQGGHGEQGGQAREPPSLLTGGGRTCAPEIVTG